MKMVTAGRMNLLWGCTSLALVRMKCFKGLLLLSRWARRRRTSTRVWRCIPAAEVVTLAPWGEGAGDKKGQRAKPVPRVAK